jgi:NAD(P)H-dependent flavin oxidoreductase YrpB (nitropropane dioxygenase family)
VSMGTRFAATQESLASADYKQLLIHQAIADIVVTDRISGLAATFMRGSIRAAGLDPNNAGGQSAILPRTVSIGSSRAPETMSRHLERRPRRWLDQRRAAHGGTGRQAVGRISGGDELEQ